MYYCIIQLNISVLFSLCSHCRCIWALHLCIQESKTLLQVYIADTWHSPDGTRSMDWV